MGYNTQEATKLIYYYYLDLDGVRCCCISISRPRGRASCLWKLETLLQENELLAEAEEESLSTQIASPYHHFSRLPRGRILDFPERSI